MFARKALLWGALAAASALSAAAYAYDSFQVQIGTPIYEPAPRAGYVWEPGACHWNGYRNVCVSGRWVPSHSYYRYDWDDHRHAWDDRRYEIYGGWDGRHRDHYSYNEDPRGYLRFDR